VEHALGTVDNPMGDAAIETKVLANVEHVMKCSQAQRIIELVNDVERLEDVSEITRLCA
jgi:transcriptional/translational regulatory protein YebC/TACO1